MLPPSRHFLCCFVLPPSNCPHGLCFQSRHLCIGAGGFKGKKEEEEAPPSSSERTAGRRNFIIALPHGGVPPSAPHCVNTFSPGPGTFLPPPPCCCRQRGGEGSGPKCTSSAKISTSKNKLSHSGLRHRGKLYLWEEKAAEQQSELHPMLMGNQTCSKSRSHLQPEHSLCWACAHTAWRTMWAAEAGAAQQKRGSGWSITQKGAAKKGPPWKSLICPWSPASQSVPAEEPAPACQSS